MDVQGVRLTISVIGTPTRRHVAIRVKVENIGTKTIKWDKELSVGHNWQVEANGVALVPDKTVISRVSGTLSRDAELRFVEIAPGRFIEKEVELTVAVHVFRSARKSVGSKQGQVIIPVGGEEAVSYAFPIDAKSIRVRLAYRPLSVDTANAFAVYFRVRPEAIGLLNQEASSNELAISISED